MIQTMLHATFRPVICTLAIILLTSGSPALCEDDEHNDKLLLMGVVSKVEADHLLIRNPSEKKEERKLLLTKQTKISFVGFKGIGKAADKPAVGFAVKAAITKDDTAKSILFSPDFPPPQEIPDKHTLTPEELFKTADMNKDGHVDYVEYATRIFQSYKHLPDRFQTKMDTDKNDVLDLPEFTATLDKLEWWRLSRKSSEEWVSTADQDKSGELETKEAKSVTGGAHGKFDKLFQKLDRDKSGGLSAKELEPFLETNIRGKQKK